MQTKKQLFSNFSRARQSTSHCYRPDNEKQLGTLLPELKASSLLARGNGMSYSDCCLNSEQTIIDMRRLNHIIAFDETTGMVTCQAGVTIKDLLHLHPEFIPPVIPGTVNATLAGAIANDVHGKNNAHLGTFGHHVEWIELYAGEQLIRCSRKDHADLFYATIGGVGLTGIITRLALRLRKASPYVEVHTEKHQFFAGLMQRMQDNASACDYQAAWLDLIHRPQAIYTYANHTDKPAHKKLHQRAIPKLPIRLVYHWSMNCFNRYFYDFSSCKTRIKHLQHFNNPLDRIDNWTRWYGKKGLVQFQAVFPVENGHQILQQLLALIRKSDATATLAVLKYLTQNGVGLLSFAQPGFTLAIDFVNNNKAELAIKAMNHLITEVGGRIYLAKDLFLDSKEFQQQYPQHQHFSTFIPANMHSDLAERLGLLQ